MVGYSEVGPKRASRKLAGLVTTSPLGGGNPEPVPGEDPSMLGRLPGRMLRGGQP
jgi:hypothetical protein